MNADKQYLDIVKDIVDNGFYSENRTVNKTYKLPHKIMTFDLSEEFPILTTKKVAFKSAVLEILWIFQKQSNDVSWLKKNKVHIWDDWEMEDGTIGESYGYVVRKYNQIDDLIEMLKNNSQSRRMLVNIWQIPHLKKAPLYPCCFLTMWDVLDDKLNCMLVQRSGDMPLGVPFNMIQYSVLVHLIAQVTNLKPGIFTHVINNAHIYENQLTGIREQLKRKNDIYPSPILELNKDIKDFYDFSIEDIKLKDYKYHPKIDFPISV